MPPAIPVLLLLLLLLTLAGPTLSQNSSCPLDFTVLNKYISAAADSPSAIPADSTSRCTYALQGLHLVSAQYLRTTTLFLPPANSSAACWSAYGRLLSPVFPPPFDLLSDCSFETPWISQGCMNITTRAAFDAAVPAAARQDMARSCNQSLAPSPPCTACTTSLSLIKAAYLPGPDHGSVFDCSAYPFIYAAGAVNRLGPSDDGTALCLFLLDSSPPPSPPSDESTTWVFGVAAGSVLLLLLAGLLIWFLAKRYRRKKTPMTPDNKTQSPRLDSMAGSTTLIKLTFEEIKAATKNFSRDYIIGKGGYGNVYRGTLSDGSEVALKRFKNCSIAGDAEFTHEVEVIASVRHMNLVALRGYCTATTALEGHQRIIVCDLMRNGSLHDHLFGSGGRKLSWPIRQRIALGTARGLAYLHYGAQPSIIHRDIKASNILLNERFEAMVADFGLARFAPEGMTHVSTRVAGTLGYVAPEYALYGQLTARSDVYSFGVVLLELLSGKKALVSKDEGRTFLLTEWAWSLVRRGRALDVIEKGMEELGPKQLLEKYVLVAVLSSHPQLQARPTMDQIVKLLETDIAVPSIPDRPISCVANMDDIERSMSSSDSGQLSGSAGYQTFTFRNDDAGCSEVVSSLLSGSGGASVKSDSLV